MQTLNLMEMDQFWYGGTLYRVGQDISFRTEKQIEDFLEYAVEEKKTYTIYPLLFGLLGGVVKHVTYYVLVLPIGKEIVKTK